MPDGYYLDNDVVLKVCAYGIAHEIIQMVTDGSLPPALLGLARFMLRSKIARSNKIVDRSAAEAQLRLVLSQVRLLEPTPEEIGLASELEAAAMEANLSLDTGESQLVVMLVHREGVSFISGDKRAARAIHHLLPGLERRFVCLEQLLFAVVERLGLEPLRSAVCGERQIDQAVTASFQCRTDYLTALLVTEGLRSYSEALRLETGSLLVEADFLSGPEPAQEHGVGCA